MSVLEGVTSGMMDALAVEGAVQSQNNDGSDGVLGALGWSDEEDWS